MRPYPWLVDYLNARLPELEGLRDTPKGLEKARSWFKALLKYFRRRQLKTPRQQKNYVVDVRNAIRSRFGEDHPALQVSDSTRTPGPRSTSRSMIASRIATRTPDS